MTTTDQSEAGGPHRTGAPTHVTHSDHAPDPLPTGLDLQEKRKHYVEVAGYYKPDTLCIHHLPVGEGMCLKCFDSEGEPIVDADPPTNKPPNRHDAAATQPAAHVGEAAPFPSTSEEDVEAAVRPLPLASAPGVAPPASHSIPPMPRTLRIGRVRRTSRDTLIHWQKKLEGTRRTRALELIRDHLAELDRQAHAPSAGDTGVSLSAPIEPPPADAGTSTVSAEEGRPDLTSPAAPAQPSVEATSTLTASAPGGEPYSYAGRSCPCPVTGPGSALKCSGESGDTTECLCSCHGDGEEVTFDAFNSWAAEVNEQVSDLQSRLALVESRVKLRRAETGLPKPPVVETTKLSEAEVKEIETEPKQIRVRCSSLDRIDACAGAAMADIIEIDNEGQPAILGRKVHELAAKMVRSGTTDCLAGLEGEESILGWTIWKAWTSVLRDDYPDPVCEDKLECNLSKRVVLTGHPDLYSVVDEGRTLNLVDWKTGWKQSGHEIQLKGYARLLLEKYPDATDVIGRVVWPRHRSISAPMVWTRQELIEWGEGFAARLERWDGKKFRTGDHCTWCPKRTGCEAHLATSRMLIARFVEDDFLEKVRATLPELSGDEILALRSRASVVEKVAAQLKKLVRTHVIETGEVTGSKAKLTVTTSKKRKVDIQAGWSVIRSYLTENQVAGLVTLTVSKMEAAVMEMAPRGTKKDRLTAFWSALEDMGAVSTKETQTVREARV